MANLTPVAANVLKGTGTQVSRYIAGVALTAGQYVYIDDDGEIQLSDADGASSAQVVDGVTANDAAAGQPVNIIPPSTTSIITPGFTAAAVGNVIYLAPNPGFATETYADVLTGDRVIVLGVMVTTTTMRFQPLIGGVKA
jgi:hypothetical protein